MNEDWSESEVELIIAYYFSMLKNEIKGIKINKSKYRRLLVPLLNDRTDGAIEYKHQNISAVLIEMGLPYIKGYLPRYNFQREMLVAKVGEHLNSNPALENTFIDFADNDITLIPSIEFNSLIVSAPKKRQKLEHIEIIRKPIDVNYIEREQNNRNLGFKGEELAMQYEQFLLRKAGKESLAREIKWISRDIGDGLGYDILSKNSNGSDKYIEVKTTKLSKETPFFFSSNEYTFSKENEMNYHLYRIFNFSDSPKMFKMNGSFDDFCYVEPIQYRGKF